MCNLTIKPPRLYPSLRSPFNFLGSPFHPRIVDVRKVRVIGGWESLCDSNGKFELAVHNTKKISLDVSEAGPGSLKFLNEFYTRGRGKLKAFFRHSHCGMQRPGRGHGTDSSGDDLAFPGKGSSDAERSRRTYLVYELRRDSTSRVSTTRYWVVARLYPEACGNYN